MLLCSHCIAQLTVSILVAGAYPVHSGTSSSCSSWSHHILIIGPGIRHTGVPQCITHSDCMMAGSILCIPYDLMDPLHCIHVMHTLHSSPHVIACTVAMLQHSIHCCSSPSGWCWWYEHVLKYQVHHTLQCSDHS